MEVFIVWGMNSVPKDVTRIAALAKVINPDRIQLNTVVRPSAADFAQAFPKEHMEKLADLFDPPAEVIAEFSVDHTPEIQANEHTILAMPKHRPCTMEEVADALGFHINEVSKYVGKLMRANRLRTEHKNGHVYYIGNSNKEINHANV